MEKNEKMLENALKEVEKHFKEDGLILYIGKKNSDFYSISSNRDDIIFRTVDQIHKYGLSGFKIRKYILM